MVADALTRNSLPDEPLSYLVDDGEDFREEIVFGPAAFGLNVRGVESAAALYRAYAAKPSKIVILDIGLDGEDGLSIASHLRASGDVRIIMATGRGSVEDRISGLINGADAYLVKPVDVRELAATVEAVGARLAMGSRPLRPSPDWDLVEGGWVLMNAVGQRLRLTTTEKRLLERFSNV
ncbi:hypothetical protein GCM10019059_43990 [Camelimonas fluminis]|uniref:Response regulator transcription factor n=1 Tax=Camelimonas fluminis TaxID=1576911 RepID=A0ABV7UK95_9HYPH|nr:response regulator [Camelimonas fluminis]GHE81179.1 hypothetical protein GCM10019059_43990 [Camelimonas fluminis]